MPKLKVAQEPELDRTHIIEGVWQSKEIHINDALITVDMVMERISDFVLEKHLFAAFVWGPDAPGEEVSVLAFGCTEFTVPETWIRSLDSHVALDVYFIDKLKALPRADFSLRCTDAELRRAMRQIKREWHQGVRPLCLPRYGVGS